MIDYLSMDKCDLNFKPIVSSRSIELFDSLLHSSDIKFKCGDIKSPCQFIISESKPSSKPYVNFTLYKDFKYCIKLYLANLIFATKSSDFHKEIFYNCSMFVEMESLFNDDFCDQFNEFRNNIVNLIEKYFYKNNVKYPSVKLNNFYFSQILNLLNKMDFNIEFDIVKDKIDFLANSSLRENIVSVDKFNSEYSNSSLFRVMCKSVEFSDNIINLSGFSISTINVDKYLAGIFNLSTVVNNDQLLNISSIVNQGGLTMFDLECVLERLKSFDFNSEIGMNETINLLCSQFTNKKRDYQTLKSLIISYIADKILRCDESKSNIYSYICND